MTGERIPESYANGPDHAERPPGKASLPPTIHRGRGERSWTVACPCTSSTGTPPDSIPARTAESCTGADGEIPRTTPASAGHDACSHCRGPKPAVHARYAGGRQGTLTLPPATIPGPIRAP